MAGKKGFGAKWETSVDAGVTWVAVANITKIRPFALKADSIDMTSHDSANQFREKMSGLLDAGQAQFDLNFDETTAPHAALVTNLGVALTHRVTFSGGGGAKKATFGGFINGLTPELPHDNKQTATATVEITGNVVIA